jgi:hypothetical protein
MPKRLWVVATYASIEKEKPTNFQTQHPTCKQNHTKYREISRRQMWNPKASTKLGKRLMTCCCQTSKQHHTKNSHYDMCGLP